MKIQYNVSLWNFGAYWDVPPLEDLLKMIREQGWGVELYPDWRHDTGLFAAASRDRLKRACDGMPVSIHTGGMRTEDDMKNHVDTAEALGSDVVVVHPGDLRDNLPEPDWDYARRAVEYADKRMYAILSKRERDFSDDGRVAHVAGDDAGEGVGE